VVLVALASHPASGQFDVGPEQLVQAGGVDVTVPGYSVPSFAYWNDDALPDLVVGEGSFAFPAKVRVYLNSGTDSEPNFTSFFYAQSNAQDITLVGGGCMGCFPRVVYWDADGLKDLLVGEAEGALRLFLNTGTDADPTFDGGTLLQVGEPGAKSDIDVGQRPTPCIVDLMDDGKKDLVVGAKDGKIRIFFNEGTDTAPDFRAETIVQANGADLIVPSLRPSPVVYDFDGDGIKDLLVGNTNGELLIYRNTGTEAEPNFPSFTYVSADGVVIDLPGIPRSRPFLCDWTGDGSLDVLVGAGDGKLHLYPSLRSYTTLSLTIVNASWGSVLVEPNLPRYFDPNTVVTLTAVPADGKGFGHWEIYDPNHPGDANHAVIDDANSSITIEMIADREVTAVFKCGSSVGALLPMMLGTLGLFMVARRRT